MEENKWKGAVLNDDDDLVNKVQQESKGRKKPDQTKETRPVLQQASVTIPLLNCVSVRDVVSINFI